MLKIEVFVPFADAREDMLAYFDNQGVIRLGGLSLTESVARDEDFAGVQAIAENFARDRMIEETGDLVRIHPDPFFGEFYHGSKLLGWEFEFYVEQVELD